MFMVVVVIVAVAVAVGVIVGGIVGVAVVVRVIVDLAAMAMGLAVAPISAAVVSLMRTVLVKTMVFSRRQSVRSLDRPTSCLEMV
jgi:hypothetical protein